MTGSAAMMPANARPAAASRAAYPRPTGRRSGRGIQAWCSVCARHVLVRIVDHAPAVERELESRDQQVGVVEVQHRVWPGDLEGATDHGRRRGGDALATGLGNRHGEHGNASDLEVGAGPGACSPGTTTPTSRPAPASVRASLWTMRGSPARCVVPRCRMVTGDAPRRRTSVA